MKVSNHSAVPVYTVSGSSTARPLPEWLARKRKRSLKYDPEYASRIELLQDFEFEEASQCIRISDDGQWVMSTGTYKPQIHTHYLPHLSLSYARHTISLNTTFLLLSSDYSKSLHLQADRSLEFHTPQGCHYTTRLPRYGRDLQFDKQAAEAIIPAVGVNENGQGEAFRLNLEVGRFMRAYEIDVGGDDVTSAGAGALQGGIATGSVNVAAVAEDTHNLLAFGTSLGTVEFWDSRSRNRVGRLEMPQRTDVLGNREETTALKFDSSGLGLAFGSSTGIVRLYDLRSPLPVLTKDQGYGYPIQDIIYLSSSTSSRGQNAEPKILSADKRIIKVWNQHDGSPWTAIEPMVDLHSVAWCKDSGMLLTANEGRQQHSFFIPQLGPAPKWCSFLDNLVEEMAEDANDPNAYINDKAGSIYDNYKFLTPSQLETLNLSHLIGTTSLLRPYMHGYFVAQRLYEEAKMIADPFVWEEERTKRVKQKIDLERESRIRGNKKVVTKVNRQLAEKLMERQERSERHPARKVLQGEGFESTTRKAEDQSEKPRREHAEGNLLSDPRFAKLFEDEDFAIDETSREFRSLNPSTKPQTSNYASTKDSDDGDDERRLTAVEQEAMMILPSSDTDDTDLEPSARKAPSLKQKSRQRPRKQSQPLMQISSSSKKTSDKDRSFGSRKEKEKPSRIVEKTVSGEREISFAPSKKSKNLQGLDQGEQKRKPDKQRRSASGNVFRKM